MTITNAPSMTLAALHTTDECATATLPVDLSAETWRTVLRVIVPANPGDVLDVEARARVTNDTGRNRGQPGYTCGIGYHLWAYDVDDGKGAARTEADWRRISTLNGDNVSRDRHHMPLHTSTVYRLPDDWPAGHRIVVVLRVDAHSTAWVSGDTITVDGEYAHMTVRRWAAPAA
ncbi:hypothetical protein ACFWMX_14570 [Streptomyces sp. NPDC058378]|uniref:hypothetical protein n=1 Tax=Streptomyces sp. NPDC058378 TaxID=3346469 RepID=UPI003661E15D